MIPHGETGTRLIDVVNCHLVRLWRTFGPVGMDLEHNKPSFYIPPLPVSSHERTRCHR